MASIEVKAKNSTAKSTRTLSASEKYDDIHCGIKLTGGNIGFSDNIYTFPYFCTFLLKRYLAETDLWETSQARGKHLPLPCLTDTTYEN